MANRCARTANPNEPPSQPDDLWVGVVAWGKRSEDPSALAESSAFPPPDPAPEGGEVLSAGRARGRAAKSRNPPQALERVRVSVPVKGSLRRAAPALDRPLNALFLPGALLIPGPSPRSQKSRLAEPCPPNHRQPESATTAHQPSTDRSSALWRARVNHSALGSSQAPDAPPPTPRFRGFLARQRTNPALRRNAHQE